MTTLDDKLRPLASRLIDKFGKSVTITYNTPGAYDPDTRTATVSASAVTANATIEDYGAGEMFASNGLIVMGDKKLTFAAADVTRPEPGDTVTIDSVVWSIISVFETWSGALVATYKVQARK